MAILGVKPIAFSCCICQNQTKVAIGFLLPFDAIYPVFSRLARSATASCCSELYKIFKLGFMISQSQGNS